MPFLHLQKSRAKPMVEVDAVLELYKPDLAAMERGRARQAAIWTGGRTDFVPILVAGPPHPQEASFPHYNLKECYYDRERMLVSHLWGMIGCVRSRSDAVPSMRANTGVGTLATVFGCKNTVFEDKMPWVLEHLTPDEALAADVSDVEERGEMPRVLEYMKYFHEKLDGRGFVYCADNQGPLDLAHILLGNRFFTALYDEPLKMHELLAKCADVIIGAVKAMKRAVAEPTDGGHHSAALYMAAGGIRICEDTTTLISPEAVREFSVPYTRRVCAEFGGGWVHFCGSGRHVLESYLVCPEVKGFNFGNPEQFDEQQVLPLLAQKGEFYFGSWPRRDGEALEGYFNRILRALGGQARGLIFQPQLRPGEADGAMDLWQALH